MRIIRETAPTLKDIDVRAVPKVRKPKLSAMQMELFDYA